MSFIVFIKNYKRQNLNSKSTIQSSETPSTRAANSLSKNGYAYNWVTFLGDRRNVKNVYNGRGNWNNEYMRFMHEAIFIIALHRKQIDCLETRILQKIIDAKGSLIVNLVVDRVSNEDAEDAEGKLIAHFRALQSDGESFSLNMQHQHRQVNHDVDNIERLLSLIDNNLNNRNYFEIPYTEFDTLFNIVYDNSEQFRNEFEIVNISNYKISVRNREICFRDQIWRLYNDLNLINLVADFINSIVRVRRLNFVLN